MSVQLLERVRQLGKVLHNYTESTLNLTDAVMELAELLNSHILVMDLEGTITELIWYPKIPQPEQWRNLTVGSQLQAVQTERLNSILSTKENVELHLLGMTPLNDSSLLAMIIPLQAAGSRLGTMVIYREASAFDVSDIILGEYGADLLSLELLHRQNAVHEAAESMREQVIQIMQNLSKKEIAAAKAVFDWIGTQTELWITTSKLAEQSHITRTVVINTLKKLAGAGVVEVQSGGAKGTYVSVKNPYFAIELKQRKF